MIFRGTIIWIGQLRSGVSASTGNTWANQDFCIEYTESSSFGTQKRHVKATISGQDRIASAQLRIGAEVSFNLQVDAHEYQGSWYDEHRAFGVRNLTAEAAFAQMGGQMRAPQTAVPQYQGQAQQTAAQQYQMQAPQTAVPQYQGQYIQQRDDNPPF